MRIGIDGMGGDNAPAEIVKGCIEALMEIEDEIYIFGDEEKINKELKKYKYDETRIFVVATTDVITNDDPPVKAVRTKTDSSLVKGINYVKENKTDVLVSAGNTGALMTGGLFILGRIPGIDRPAIASIMPIITTGKAMLLADSGANAECKPNNLLEFGIMGSIYMEKVLNIESPRVGLINIGTEDTKGTTVVKAAYEMLAKSDLNFIGNVESREIPSGVTDVAIADGFVGNVVLKLTEGVALNIFDLLKEKFTEDARAKLGAIILSSKLKELKKVFDYSEYGGAPILGIKGALVKVHGSSNANAIKNAILKAKPYVENNVVKTIHDAVLSLEEIEQ